MLATIDMRAKDLACDLAYAAEIYRNEHSRLSDALTCRSSCH